MLCIMNRIIDGQWSITNSIIDGPAQTAGFAFFWLSYWSEKIATKWFLEICALLLEVVTWNNWNNTFIVCSIKGKTKWTALTRKMHQGSL